MDAGGAPNYDRGMARPEATQPVNASAQCECRHSCPGSAISECECRHSTGERLDIALALQVQEHVLRRLLGRDRGRVDNNVSVGRLLVWVRDPRELLEHAGPSLRVQAFAVARLAHL